jgi:hypothetical protein
VHDWNIEAAASALDGPVSSADYRDAVAAIDNVGDAIREREREFEP